MITSPQDTKKYMETVPGEVRENPTSPLYKKYENLDHQEAHSFRYKFINKQIKESRLILKKSSNPRSLSQLGDGYLLDRNYKKAVEHFMMAISIDPDFIVAYEKLILALTASRRFSEANDYFSRLISITKRNSDVLHKYAIFKTLLDQTTPDPDEALSVLDEILEKNPRSFDVLNTYGLILLNKKNKTEEAKASFTKALEYNSEYVHSINNLGVCFLNEKKFKDAEKNFLRAIELVPDYLQGYQNLSATYIHQEKYELAYDILKKAKYRQMRLEDVWEHKIGWLLIKLNRVDEAIEWHQQKLKSESHNYLLYNNLGVCYKLKNDLYKAELAFKRSIKELIDSRHKIIGTDQLRAFYNLARLARDKGDSETVSQIADTLLKMNPLDAYALYLKGVSFSLGENFLKAEEYFSQSLSLDKNNPELYPDYAFILESIDKDYKGAIKLLEDAIELNYGSPVVDNNLAYVYIKSGQVKKAEKILNNYGTDEEYGPLLATKGLLEFNKGNLKGGVSLYEMSFNKLTGKNTKIAKQILFCEKALYWLNKKDIEKSEEELFQAKILPQSYMSPYVEEVQEKINVYKKSL